MNKRLHKIADDLQLILGRPRWEWPYTREGVRQIETHVRNHAELERQYPEETSEADD